MKRCDANDPNYNCPRPSGNSSNIIPTTVDSLSALPDYMQNHNRQNDPNYDCPRPSGNSSNIIPTTVDSLSALPDDMQNHNRQNDPNYDCPRPSGNSTNPIPTNEDSLSALPDDMQNDNRQKQPELCRAQVFELERWFAKYHYLCKRQRSELAKRLGTTEDRVKIWFSNRRAQIRLLQRAASEREAEKILFPNTVAASAAPAAAAGYGHALDPVLMNPYIDPFQMGYGVGVPVPQLPFPYFPNTHLATPATSLPLAYDKILQPIPSPTTHAINRPNSNTAFNTFHHNNSSSASLPHLTYTQHCTPSSWPNYYNQNHSSAMHNTEQQNAKETVESSSPTEREQDFK